MRFFFASGGAIAGSTANLRLGKRSGPDGAKADQASRGEIGLGRHLAAEARHVRRDLDQQARQFCDLLGPGFAAIAFPVLQGVRLHGDAPGQLRLVEAFRAACVFDAVAQCG